MSSVHVEIIGHDVVVSYMDTVIARYAFMESDDAEYLIWFVSKVITCLGYVVEEA